LATEQQHANIGDGDFDRCKHRFVTIELFDPPAENGIGQDAAAGRGGKVGDAEFFCKSYLVRAAPPAHAEQPAAVHPALLLRQGLVHELGAERPQEERPGAGIALDHIHGVAALGHRPLPQHFAGDEKRGALLGQHRFCPGKHHDLAVDAGVEVLAEAMGGIMQQPQIAFADIFDDHVDAVLLPDPRLVACRIVKDAIIEEGRDKLNGLHPDTLRHNHPCGENRIEPAGKKGQRFNLVFHLVHA